MTILIKTVGGIVEEMYNVFLGDDRLSHGDKFPDKETEPDAVEHFLLINTELGKDRWIWRRVSEEAWCKEVKDSTNILIPDLRNGQVYFRFHRGTLDKALRTACKVNSKEELKTIILDRLKDYIAPNGEMTIEKYGQGVDDRIGWDTYIVSWDKIPQGFLSGDLK